MNKKDLIATIACKTNLTKKEIDSVLTLILELIIDKVSLGERVRLVGFGSFYKVNKVIDIRLEENILLSKGSIVKFSPGKFFKQRINI